MSIIYINPYQFAAAAGYDPDAQDFINRVIAADVAAGNTSGLEVGVQDAYNDFFVGCKADGTFNALKAACCMRGARTLAGALVPLVSTMPAPTNYNFVAGDYDRKTGLVGDGSTKYLDSNFNFTVDLNPATSAYNNHVSVYAAAGSTLNTAYFGYYLNSTTNLQAINNNGAANILNMGDGTGQLFSRGASTGLWGTSRNNNNVSFRVDSTNFSLTSSPNSTTHANTTVYIFARALASPVPINGRLAFYSIGESLDLALLDARVTTLVNAIGAAIP